MPTPNANADLRTKVVVITALLYCIIIIAMMLLYVTGCNPYAWWGCPAHRVYDAVVTSFMPRNCDPADQSRCVEFALEVNRRNAPSCSILYTHDSGEYVDTAMYADLYRVGTSLKIVGAALIDICRLETTGERRSWYAAMVLASFVGASALTVLAILMHEWCIKPAMRACARCYKERQGYTINGIGARPLMHKGPGATGHDQWESNIGCVNEEDADENQCESDNDESSH